MRGDERIKRRGLEDIRCGQGVQRGYCILCIRLVGAALRAQQETERMSLKIPTPTIPNMHDTPKHPAS